MSICPSLSCFFINQYSQHMERNSTLVLHNRKSSINLRQKLRVRNFRIVHEGKLLTDSVHWFPYKAQIHLSRYGITREFWPFLKIWLIKTVPEICTQANVMKTLFYIMKILSSQCITSQVEQLCMQNCLCVHMYTVFVLHTKKCSFVLHWAGFNFSII